MSGTAQLADLLDGRQNCPICGGLVTWDEEHEPHAWRHKHDSRWCGAIGNDSPRLARGTTDRYRTTRRSKP